MIVSQERPGLFRLGSALQHVCAVLLLNPTRGTAIPPVP